MTDINVVDPAQPVTILAAESGIHVGVHTEANWFGLTVNTDTLLSTSIAAVIVLALAFYLRSKVTASGVPSGVQLFWEAITVQTRNQIESAIGMKIAPFVLPLAVTLFVFILVANWLSVFPWQYRDETGIHEFLKPAAADINFVLALGLFVFICYHAAGFWRRGVVGHPIKLVKGHVAFLAPINIVEELAKPISLSLRLFGNVFAGGIMVTIIALFPAYIMWAPNALWKSFELFIGAIQAFIFALLTIPFGWEALNMTQTIALILSGFCGGFGQIMLTESYRHGEVSTIAPFEYTSVLLSIVIGYFVFAEVPGWAMIVGSAIVTASGIFIIYRERQIGLKRKGVARRSVTPQG